MFDFDSALGIEIRGNQMVLATLGKGFGGFTLKNQRLIDGALDLEVSELHSRVQNYVRSNGFNKENVILGIPRDRVVVHTIELPLDVEENLDQVVSFQVGKLAPVQETPSYYDYVVLDRDETAKSLTLQIVMLPANEVEERLKLLAELNLYPAAIRISSYGTQQVLRLHEDGYGGPCIILDIGETGTEFLLIPGSGQCLTHMIASAAGEATLDGLLEELGLFFSRLRLKDATIRKLYLCGSRAEEFLPGLQDRFGDVALLSEGMRLSGFDPKSALSDRIVSSIGLAASGVAKSPFSRFNLIPAEKRLTGDRPSFIPTVVLAALLLVVVVAAGTREYFQQNHFLESVAHETDRLRPQVDRAIQLRQQLQQRLGEARELGEMMQGRQTVLLVLRDLTERIPEDTYLQSINVRGDQVSITGISDVASRLITILSESEHLTNVESRYITRDPASGKNKFNFEARIRADESMAP
jgi:Tfp pilus assembly protein PilN